MESADHSCLLRPFLLFAGIFVSWHIEDRTKEFYIFLLILAAATIGVFMSLDLFFLYFFYEMSVLPMYVLLGIWGSHTKGYLSMTDSGGHQAPRLGRIHSSTSAQIAKNMRP